MKDELMSNIVPGVFFGFRKAKRIVYKGMTRAPFIKENFELNLYSVFDSTSRAAESEEYRYFWSASLQHPLDIVEANKQRG